jgi:hypothetical protein
MTTDCSRFSDQGECCDYCHREGRIYKSARVSPDIVRICYCLAADMGQGFVLHYERKFRRKRELSGPA